MKTSLALGVAFVAASTSVSTSAAQATQCLRLSNSTASIYSAVSFIADKKSDLANLPLYEILAPLDQELPWLSTCLGSANILSVGLGLLSDPVASKCVSSLTGSGSSSNTSNSSNTTSLLSGDTDFSTSLCPSMNTTIFPCVNNVLVGAIEKLIESGGDCCADMKKKLPELLGQDLKPFMESMMKRVGDVVCSVQTYVDPADGKTKTHTCGNALVSTVLSGQDLFDLVQLLQIPNDQACAAMKGQNFTATNGGSYKFFTNAEPIDSCFAPMNNLFTDLGKLPMIAQSNISAMFDAGKCLKGDTVISMAQNEKGLIMGMSMALDKVVADMKLMPAGAVTKVMRNGFDDLKPDFGPMCFHMANSVQDCVYNTTVAYAFSQDAPPPTTAKGGDKSGPSGGSSAARGSDRTLWMTALVMVSSVGMAVATASL